MAYCGLIPPEIALSQYYKQLEEWRKEEEILLVIATAKENNCLAKSKKVNEPKINSKVPF